MLVRARFKAAADQIPLPLETVGGIASAALAQHLRPLELPGWTRPPGSALTGLGIVLVIEAWRERGRGSLETPQALVTRGLHAHSRNPIYLGCTAIQLGLAGPTRNAWMLATCPVSAALLHRWVLREERSLRESFGDEYDAYRARVRRYV